VPEDRIEPLNDSRRLRFAVTDYVWDHFDINDDANVEWFVEHIERPLLALICHYEGHVVVNDQCNKPEHRYCAVCNAPMPNEPTNG
jgi:hypothetical protein